LGRPSTHVHVNVAALVVVFKKELSVGSGIVGGSG
jgi:hypothetical protein